MHVRWYVVLICLGIFIVTGSCSNRIVGGRPVKEGEIPFQVSLRYCDTGRHFCGGSLLTKQYVLTAAHCMYIDIGISVPVVFMTAVAGQLDLPITSKTVYRNCTRKIEHQTFDYATGANDICVLEVDKNFPVHSFRISIVTLRKNAISSGLCVVSGWGKTLARICGQPELGKISDILLTTEVNIMPYSKCGNGSDPLSTLCAGVEKGGKGACQGDSGGPLMCDGLQTGVVSTGCGCAQAEYPAIYTDVAKFYPWINNIIKLGYVEEFSSSKYNITISSDESSGYNIIISSDETSTTKRMKLLRNDANMSILWLPIIILLFILLKLLYFF